MSLLPNFPCLWSITHSTFLLHIAISNNQNCTYLVRIPIYLSPLRAPTMFRVSLYALQLFGNIASLLEHKILAYNSLPYIIFDYFKIKTELLDTFQFRACMG
jgi:hypothetical protein